MTMFMNVLWNIQLVELPVNPTADVNATVDTECCL